ncbi:MAG: hypothetical protein QOD66_3449 [Solirubrobacteraceae bacterium]|jgi:hypothetical protein|nr:hypothetical protein [Solirubrobacteraceae bacterium]
MSGSLDQRQLRRLLDLGRLLVAKPDRGPTPPRPTAQPEPEPQPERPQQIPVGV